MSNPIVEELERRFLSALRSKADQLRREFPSIRINTWSSPVGCATSYQGHNLGIDCLFPKAPSDRPDNVALSIGVMHLTTQPKLCDAAVCWGAGPSEGCHNLDLIESPIPYSTAALDQIEAGLPALYEALMAALRNPPFANDLS
jgi:hypothetical protein